MKLKKLLCLFLALCLLTSLPITASAEAEEAAVQTVRALGIMVGDENGNLNLGNNVTRAEFTKMLVAASNQRDSVRLTGTGYSVFTDVGGTHWASDYIRIAASQNYMIGYTDGSFRPNNNIKLEEACTAVLRLLGYDASTLTGAFPTAQLNKAAELGLRAQITRNRGETMTRLDCARLFANLFSVKTFSGALYCTTLGFASVNGSVDIASAVQSMLTGPFVAQSGTTLPFKPVTVYRDGIASASAQLQENDVYYYNERIRALWICTDRISGAIAVLSPSAASPSSVTVAGSTYSLSGTAAYRLSSLSGDWIGKTVTLLLGINGEVVDILTGSHVNDTYYGIVQSCENTALDAKSAAVETKITVICTDGAKRTFTVGRKANYSIGTLVTVTVNSSGTDVSQLSKSTLSGYVSEDGKKLGDYKLADDVEILDSESSGAAIRVAKERICGIYLNSGDVQYYSSNARGEIDTLILRSVTGDAWTYGYVTNVNKSASTVVYSVNVNGQATTYRPTGNTSSFPAGVGGCAIDSSGNGTANNIRQLAEIDLTSVGASTAAAGNQKFDVWESVQVYLRQDGEFYPTTISAINTENYQVTGWYDNFTGAAGGKIRVIVAVRK